MGAAVFGFGLLLVASLVGWALEKMGVIETPARSRCDLAESAHRENGGA
jgi:hypothetical protein